MTEIKISVQPTGPIITCPSCLGCGVGKIIAVCCGSPSVDPWGNTECCEWPNETELPCELCKGAGKLVGEDCVHGI